MKTTQCDKCKEHITNNNFKSHYNSCDGTKKSYYHLDKKWMTENGHYECPYCGSVYNKYGIKNHIWRSHGFGRDFNPIKRSIEKGSFVSWNKGLTKNDHPSIAKISNVLQKKFQSGQLTPKGYCGFTYKQRSEKAKEQGFGGYREKAGRSKKFLVTDSFGRMLYVQSSYEYKCAEILDELNILWKRPKALKYILKNREKNYYPDFYLTEYDIYLDPKNDFLITKDEEKIKQVEKQNNVRILILSENQLNKEYILGWLSG